MNTLTLPSEPKPQEIATPSPPKLWLNRMVMVPPMIISARIGLRFLTDTARAVPGVSLTTPEAMTDTRVMGVWMITFAIMVAMNLFSKQRLWLGHLQIAFFMGLVLAVRIFGFMHDGTTLAMGNQRFITIMETVFLLLNSIGLITQLIQRERSKQA